MTKTHNDAGDVFLGWGNFDDGGILEKFHPHPQNECNLESDKANNVKPLTFGDLVEMALSFRLDFDFESSELPVRIGVNDHILCHNVGCGKAV